MIVSKLSEGDAYADKPLTAAALAAAPAQVQKRMVGEKLYPTVVRLQPDHANKIVGVMLEVDNDVLLKLLESDEQMKHHVERAMGRIVGSPKIPAIAVPPRWAWSNVS